MIDRARPGPARLAALDVVTRTLAGEFLAPTLRNVLDASDLEGIERSQVTDLSYGTLRRLQQLDVHLAPSLKRPDKLPPRVLGALRLGVYDLLYRHTPAHAAVSQWVEVVKAEAAGLAPLANAVLRGVERRALAASRQPGTARPVDPQADLALPEWLWQELRTALGPQAASDAAYGMLDPEPLWLTAFSDAAEAALLADGCEVSALSPGAAPPATLRVRSPLPLDRLTAFSSGLVQPQNPTSLQAALALGAERGAVVFDLASGRGIKSAVLAATGACVTGVELAKRRIRAAGANLERLGLAVTHVAADLVTTPYDELLQSIATANGWQQPRCADAVLLDAPCSGTGTLRGHPEIKLRLTPTDLNTLAAVQETMLVNAAALVAAGGTLLYTVCALTAREGPQVVADFLVNHPEFSAQEVDTALPQVRAGAGVFVLPVDGLDGFYIAKLTRSADRQSGEGGSHRG